MRVAVTRRPPRVRPFASGTDRAPARQLWTRPQMPVEGLVFLRLTHWVARPSVHSAAAHIGPRRRLPTWRSVAVSACAQAANAPVTVELLAMAAAGTTSRAHAYESTPPRAAAPRPPSGANRVPLGPPSVDARRRECVTFVHMASKRTSQSGRSSRRSRPTSRRFGNAATAKKQTFALVPGHGWFVVDRTKPDVPCQYQGPVMGGGTTFTVALVH